jgi:hypothetical protein
VSVRQADLFALWPSIEGSEDIITFDLRGCKGQNLSSQQIADENLEEEGANALFRALYPPRGLVATGLNRQRLRETIPPEYWEMATMDPGRTRDRHYVSFIDDELEGYGGQLTPVGETSPLWFGIRGSTGRPLCHLSIICSNGPSSCWANRPSKLQAAQA